MRCCVRDATITVRTLLERNADAQAGGLHWLAIFRTTEPRAGREGETSVANRRPEHLYRDAGMLSRRNDAASRVAIWHRCQVWQPSGRRWRLWKHFGESGAASKKTAREKNVFHGLLV